MDFLLIALGIRSRRRERAVQARIAHLERWDHPVRIHYPLPPMPPARTRQPARYAGVLVVVAVFLVAFAIAALVNAAGL